MTIDATFWVAISFIIFFAGLIYLKVPKKINELLNKLILDIKNEIDESEKKIEEYNKIINDSKIEAKNYFNQNREKILKDINKKKRKFRKSN